ncbi:MAG TPA: ABC transporter permease, partial [Pyrinomonadaceae bacterium]|nr:ABC transporter permease [Pyrinomonadaceae bacterium]
LIVSLQCLMLFVTIKFFDLTGLMKLPGYLGGIPQLLVMILTGVVGIAMGLFISAVVKTSEMATSLVPLVLIPQILFSGLVVMPEGISKVVGVTMPVTWSFDEMKRLSMLETLSEEGSDPDGPHKGRGLHKYIEDLNDQNIKKAQNEMEAYKYKAEDDLALFEEKMNNYLRDVRTKPTLKPPKPPKLGPAPKVPEVTKIPEDLSDYVDFLHPWGHIILNPLVLLLMFFGLTGATIAALRAQDIG